MNFLSNLFAKSAIIISMLFIVIAIPLVALAQGDADDASNIADNIRKTERAAREDAKKEIAEVRQVLNAVLFKNALDILLQTLAEQTAKYVVSGGKGQVPLIFTDQWDTYLQSVGEAAVATTVINIADLAGLGNICISPEIAIDILLPQIKPPTLNRPRCSLQQLAETWDVTSPTFLENFTLSFETGQNDLGVAVSFMNQIAYKKELAEKAGEKERETGEGFKSQRERLSQVITTPGPLIKSAVEENYITSPKTRSAANIFVGDLIADTIGAFQSTLMGAFVNKLKGGLFSAADLFSASNLAAGLRSQALDSLTNSEATGLPGSLLSDVKLRDVFTPNIVQPSSFNIIGELGTCGSEVGVSGLYNCTADTQFILAIQGNAEGAGFYTVEEAVEKGFLYSEWSFGFVDPLANIEPSYTNGYSYSNMKKLRRLRIIPVGWELAALRARELGTRVTLGQMLDAFDDASSPFYKLVDPNWVLKVPNIKCTAKVNSQIAIGGGASRTQECVDLQDCVAFGDSGECLSYAYCTHEKRSWDFPGQTCAEHFATCDEFTNQSDEDGGSSLWLSSTLDYEGCSVDTAGCTWYAATRNAVGEWNSGDRIYLTDAVDICEDDQVGCNTYIRMGSESNLILNSSFEVDNGTNYVLGAGDSIAANDIPDGWQASNVIVNPDSDSPIDGNFAVKLNATGSSNCSPGLIYQPSFGAYEVGQNYILSGYVKSDSAETRNIQLNFQGIVFTVESVGQGWKPFAFSFVMPGTSSSYTLSLGINDGDCSTLDPSVSISYDAIQLEKGVSASAYKQYGQTNVVHLQNAPACTFEEVGCQRYIPSNPEQAFEVTGIATGADVCPAECVGYQSYLQKPTDFEPERFENFIASSIRSCNAESVGCEQFTNLDEVALGGEGIEYYTEIRHCEKPQESCGSFFVWEGSDTTGYQLRSYSLVTDAPDGSGNPLTTDGSDTCDPESPDCLEFVAEDGTRTFRNINKVITCSESCVPLRARAGLVTQEECEAQLGTYDTSSERCVFQAIASESQVCQPQFVGCREYVGNTGENVIVTFADNFEQGALIGWTNSFYSTEATEVGGNSLKVEGDIDAINETVTVPVNSIRNGANYIVDFTAKASVSDFNQVSVYLGDEISDSTRLGGFVTNTDSWNQYSVGPLQIPEGVDPLTTQLIITVEGLSSRNEQMNFFIDNVLVRRIRDSVYGIKDSWDTPLSCDTNPPIEGGTASRSMVGCQAYSVEDDPSGKEYYLKSFSRLCSEEKIGCEAVLDTHNSSSPAREIFNEGDLAEVVVPEDSVTYVVVNEDYECDESEVGCMELGEPTFDLEKNVTEFTSRYIINNPDTYNETLCRDGSLFCKQYRRSDGTLVYAKDPLLSQCEYKAVPGSFPTRYAWYVIGDDTEENPDVCVEAKDNDYALRCDQSNISCTQFYEPITQESYFYKKNSIFDQSEECNGVVDWKRGCVLFNDLSERDLLFKSGEDVDFIGAPDGCQTGDVGCNTNSLLKVNLNRVCSQWVTGTSLSRFWDKNLNQYRTSSYGLGRCLEADPSNPNLCLQWDNNPDKPRLTIGEYQARETSWSAEDLTGYSIPNLYPIETLRQRSVAITPEGDPESYILTKLSAATGPTCTSTTDCPAGQVCRVELDQTTAEYSGRCYVEQGIDGTGTISTPECRAYPEGNSPFPSSLAVFAPESDEKNPGSIVRIDQAFADAQIGQEGEDVDCSYHQVTYGALNRYYGLDTIPPTYATIDGEQVLFDKQDTYLGWQGYCLEQDPSRLINGSDDEFACLTWYPVDLIQGVFDVNNSAIKAGYLVGTGAEYYCAEAVIAEWRSQFQFCARSNCGEGYETIRGGSCSGHSHNRRYCVPQGGDGWYPYNGSLIGVEQLGVMCTKVARIADSQGRNAAWTTRILGGTLPGSQEYFVNDLGWGYHQANIPYGSARPGVLRLDDLTQPLLALNPNEYVAGCEECEYQHARDDIDDITGFARVPFGICQDENPNRKGKPCPLYPNAGSPFALGTDSSDLSSINDENVPIRKDNKTRKDEPQPYPGNEDYTAGFNRLQLLFARSYGVWEWQSTPNICVGTCTSGPLTGEYCDSNQACGGDEPGITYSCEASVCIGGANNGETCGSNADCTFAQTNTVHQCVVEQGPNQDPNNPDYICESGPWAGQPCTDLDDCSESTANGVCSGTTDTYCVAKDSGGNVVNGDSSGIACSDISDCTTVGTCSVNRCSNEQEGQSAGICSGKSAGDFCGTTSVTNRYVRIPVGAEAFGWDLYQNNPAAAQTPILRPAVTDPSSVNGFNEGSITGFSVNGQTSGTIEAQSGTAPVTVSFYAYNENGEQMPLRLLLVDWGDGTDPVEARGAFKNHKHQCRSFCSQAGQQGRACSTDEECQDDQNPEAQCLPFNFGDSDDACIDDSLNTSGFFTFSHTYTCEGSSPCTYSPTVLVKDNWGATTSSPFAGSITVQPRVEPTPQVLP